MTCLLSSTDTVLWGWTQMEEAQRGALQSTGPRAGPPRTLSRMMRLNKALKHSLYFYSFNYLSVIQLENGGFQRPEEKLPNQEFS